MIEGIAAGLIYSLTLYPGMVWLTKVGLAGNRRQVAAVGLAFWLSHIVWLLISSCAVLLMIRNLSFLKMGIHIFAAFVLLYMARKFFLSRRVETLRDPHALPGSGKLFWSAFKQSFAMPLRLPAAVAITTATGVGGQELTVHSLSLLFFGIFLGITWWWGKFTLIGIFFVRRVERPTTIRSLNRLRTFCAYLSVALAGVSLIMIGGR